MSKAQIDSLRQTNIRLYNDLLTKNSSHQLEVNNLNQQLNNEKSKVYYSDDNFNLQKQNNALRLLLKIERLKSIVLHETLKNFIPENNIESSLEKKTKEVLSNKELQDRIDSDIEVKIKDFIPTVSGTETASLNVIEKNATRSALKEILLTQQSYLALVKHLKNTWAPENEKEKTLLPFIEEKEKEILATKGEAWLDEFVTSLVQKHLYALPRDINFLSQTDEIIKKEVKKNSGMKV